MVQRFQEQQQIQRVQTSTGAAQGMLSLADRLSQFEKIGVQLATAGIQRVQKEQAVKGAGTGRQAALQLKPGEKPTFKKEPKFFGGVEERAHNVALRNAYTASVKNDIRKGVAEIEANNPDNLIGFNEAVNGFSKGMLENVDPSIRDDVQLALNDRITSSQIAVQNANIKKDNDIAGQELATSSQSALDEALRFARNGDLQSSAAGLIDFNETLQQRVEAGFITQPQANQLKRDAELRATQENLVGTVRSLVSGGNTLKALDFLERSESKVPVGMSVEEHNDLTAAMASEINAGINLNNKQMNVEKKRLEQNQKNNYSDLSISITEGSASTTDVVRNLRNGNITEAQFDKLINTINRRGQGVDNFHLINNIRAEMQEGNDPDTIKDIIISNSGTNLTEATASSLIGEVTEMANKESILNTSPVKRARDFIVPSIRITGIAGALDPDAERRLAESIRDFDTRVLEGEDPWQVADELVGKDALERAPQPKFGTKDDLKLSMENLNAQFDQKLIDEPTYNFEYEKIQNLQRLKDNIAAFEKSRKEANANIPRG